VAYYANELSINEMKPGDWLVAPYQTSIPTLTVYSWYMLLGCVVTSKLQVYAVYLAGKNE